MTERAQFQAVLAGQTVARTAHFVLHRKPLPPDVADALFPPCPVGTTVPMAWIGAMVPKRWARRAVTRNAIRRQVYTLTSAAPEQFVGAAHLVRLRAGFAKTDFPSATSTALKIAVRTELQLLFSRARP